MAGLQNNIGERTTIEFQFQYNQQQLQALRQAILEIQKEAKNIKISDSTLHQLQDWLKNIDKGATSFTNITHQANLFGKNIQQSASLTAKTISELNMIPTANSKISNGIKLINSGLSNSLKTVQTTKSVLDKFGDTLFNSAKWTIATSAVKAVQQQFSNAAQYVTNIDKSINNIRIVTKKANDEMTSYLKSANSLAQQLGTTTNRVAQSSLIYYQQGLSDEAVQKRAETTIKAANVTKQSVTEVSESLTALWNGFQISQDEIESSVDKLAAVAAKSASNLSELTTAISKTSSVAHTLGLDLDQLTAQIATIISTTRQAPESVGTALRTIYARIGDLVKDGTDEFGVSLGTVSGQLQSVGIEILNTDGSLKDMGDIIDNIAKKWDTWTAAQKQAIAIAVAGKRQYNNLFALFENWDQYNQNLDTAKNSLGELQKQQDIFLESYEAKLQKINASWEGVMNNFKDDTAFKGLLDGINGLVQGFGVLTKNMGFGGASSIFSLLATGINQFSNPIRENMLGIIDSQYNKNLNRYSRETNKRLNYGDTSLPSEGWAKEDVAAIFGQDLFNDFERELSSRLSKSLYNVANQFSAEQLLQLEKNNERVKDQVLPFVRSQAKLFDQERDALFNADYIFSDLVDTDRLNVTPEQIDNIVLEYLKTKADTLSSGKLYEGVGLKDFVNERLGFTKDQDGNWKDSIENYFTTDSKDFKEELRTLNDTAKDIRSLIKKNNSLSNDSDDGKNDTKSVDKFATGGTKDNKGNVSITPIDKSVLNPGDPDRYLVQARVADGEVLQVIPKKDVKNPIDAGIRVGKGWDNYAQIPGYSTGANWMYYDEFKQQNSLAGVYKYYYTDPETGKRKLYIGQTNNLIRRYTEHISQDKTIEKDSYKVLPMPGAVEKDLLKKEENLIRFTPEIKDKNLRNELLKDNKYKELKSFYKGGRLDNTGRISALPGYSRGTDNFRQINFDMDGTIADLYGRMAELYPGWDTKSSDFWKMVVETNDAEGYRSAKPLVNLQRLKELLYQLQEQGWRWGITSWLAGGKDHPEYDNAVRAAKKAWLKANGLEPDETHIVKYGTPKASVTAKHKGTQILFDDEPQNRTVEGAREVAKKRGLEDITSLDKLAFEDLDNDRIAYDVHDIIGTLENLLASSKKENDIKRLTMPIIDARTPEKKKQLRNTNTKYSYGLDDKDPYAYGFKNKYPTVYFQDEGAAIIFDSAYDSIQQSLENGTITQDQKDLIDSLLSDTNIYVGDYGEHKGDQAYVNDKGNIFLSKTFNNDGSTLVHELFHLAQQKYGNSNIIPRTKKMTNYFKDIKFDQPLMNEGLNSLKPGREYDVGKAVFTRQYIEKFAEQHLQDSAQKDRFILAATSMVNDMTRGSFSTQYSDEPNNYLGVGNHPKEYYRYNRSISGKESSSEYAALSYTNSQYKNLLDKLFTELGLENFIKDIKNDFEGAMNNPKVQQGLHKFRQLRGYNSGINSNIPTFAEGGQLDNKGNLVSGDGYYDNGKIQLTKIPNGVLQPGDPDRYLMQARVADGETIQVIPKDKVKNLPGYAGGLNNEEFSREMARDLQSIREQLFGKGIALQPQTIAALKQSLEDVQDDSQAREDLAKTTEKISRLFSDSSKVAEKQNRDAAQVNTNLETNDFAQRDRGQTRERDINLLDNIIATARYTDTFNAGKMLTGSIGTNIANIIRGDINPIAIISSLFGGYSFYNSRMQMAHGSLGKGIEGFRKLFTPGQKLKDGYIFNEQAQRYQNQQTGRFASANDALTSTSAVDKLKDILKDPGSLASMLSVAGIAMGIGSAVRQIYNGFTEYQYQKASQSSQEANTTLTNTNNTIQAVRELNQQYKEQKITTTEYRSKLMDVTKSMEDASISALAFAGNINQLTKALEDQAYFDRVAAYEASRNANAAALKATDIFADIANTFIRVNAHASEGSTTTGETKARRILAQYGLDENQLYSFDYMQDPTRLASFISAYKAMTRDSDIMKHSDIFAQMGVYQQSEQKLFTEQRIKEAQEAQQGTILNAAYDSQGNSLLNKTQYSLSDFNNILVQVAQNLDGTSVSLQDITSTIFDHLGPNLDTFTKNQIEQQGNLINSIVKVNEGNIDLAEAIRRVKDLTNDQIYALNLFNSTLDLTNSNLIEEYNKLSDATKQFLSAQYGFQTLLNSPFVKANSSLIDKANFLKSGDANSGGTFEDYINKVFQGSLSYNDFESYNGVNLAMATLNALKTQVGTIATKMGENRQNLNQWYNTHPNHYEDRKQIISALDAGYRSAMSNAYLTTTGNSHYSRNYQLQSDNIRQALVDAGYDLDSIGAPVNSQEYINKLSEYTLDYITSSSSDLAIKGRLEELYNTDSINNLDEFVKNEEDRQRVEEELNYTSIDLVQAMKDLSAAWKQLAEDALKNIQDIRSTIKDLEEIFEDFNEDGVVSLDHWTNMIKIMQKEDALLMDMIERDKNGKFSYNEEKYNNYIRDNKTAAFVGTINGLDPVNIGKQAIESAQYSNLQGFLDAIDIEHRNYDTIDEIKTAIEEAGEKLYPDDADERNRAVNETLQLLRLDQDSQNAAQLAIQQSVLGINTNELSVDESILAVTTGIAGSLGVLVSMLGELETKDGEKLKNIKSKKHKQVAKKDENGNTVYEDGKEYNYGDLIDELDAKTVATEKAVSKYINDAMSTLVAQETKFSEATLGKTWAEILEITEGKELSYEDAIKRISDLLLSDTSGKLEQMANAALDGVSSALQGVLSQVQKTLKKDKNLQKILKDSQNTWDKTLAKGINLGGIGRTYSKDRNGGGDSDKPRDIDYYAQVKRLLADINTQVSKIQNIMQHVSGGASERYYHNLAVLQEQIAARQLDIRSIAAGEKLTYSNQLLGLGVDVSDYVLAQQQIAAIQDKDVRSDAENLFNKYKTAEEEDRNAQIAYMNAKFEAANNRWEEVVAEQRAMISYLETMKTIETFNMTQDNNKYYRDQFREYTRDMRNLINLSNTNTESFRENLDAMREVWDEYDDGNNPYMTNADALKKMQEFHKQAQESANQLFSNLQQAYQDLTQYISDLKSQMDLIQSQFNLAKNTISTIKSLIDEHRKIGLNYYKDLEKYYNSAITISKRQITSMRTEADMWKELYDSAEKGSKEQYTYLNNWINATQQLQQEALNLSQIISDKLSNAIDKASLKYERFITLGKDFNFLDIINNFANDQSDKFFDEIEQIGKAEKLRFDIFNDLDNEDYSEEHRKRILEFYEEEHEYLLNKKDLTEADVKLSNLKYELLKKQIALEEAQKAKNAMKLVRNAQGNWSYQYVADKNEENKIKGEINDVYQEIQDLGTEQRQNAISGMISGWKDYQNELVEIAGLDISQEEKDARAADAFNRYQQLLEQYKSQYDLYTNTLIANTADWANFLNQVSTDTFKNTSESMQKLIETMSKNMSKSYNDTVHMVETNLNQVRDYGNQVLDESLANWNTYATAVIDQWTSDNGESVKSQMLLFWQSIQEAEKEYEQNLLDLQEVTGITFFSEQGIITALDLATISTTQLNEETQKLADDGVKAIDQYTSHIQTLENAWSRALEQLRKYDEMLQQIADDVANNDWDIPEPTITPATIGPIASSTSGSSPGGSNPIAYQNKDGSTPSSINGSKYNMDVGTTIVTPGSGSGVTYSYTRPTSNALEVPKTIVPLNPYDKTQADLISYMDKIANPIATYKTTGSGQKKRYQLYINGKISGTYASLSLARAGARAQGATPSFDTGGYTGDWSGNDGKLAVLHKKEQIFNAEDTQLLHNAAQALTSNNELKQALLSYSNSYKSPIHQVKETISNGDVYNVTANFPNANDAEEIRQALLSLPNIMSQYITTNNVMQGE